MEATITKLGIQDIPLEEILVVTNPRKRFDEEALADLARSIAEDGLLQAILVRVITDEDHEQWAAAAQLDSGEAAAVREEHRYELVAGERRLRAHRLNGAETIRADVREMTRAKAAELRLVENLQREDLHELEEAAAYHELLEAGEFTVETLAERVGRSISYVYQRLKLRELIPPAQEAFFEEEITAGHAILIARLAPTDQQEALEFAVEERWTGERTSVRALGRWIQNGLHLSLDDAPWDAKDAKLVPEAGPCETCPKRAGSNPELYGDLEPETCTDRRCYERKQEAFVARALERQAQKQEGGPIVRLSTSWQPSPNGKRPKEEKPIGAGEWHEISSKSDRCKHVTTAVVTDAPYHTQRLGQAIQVCVEPGCKKHRRGGQLPAEEKKRRARLKIDAAEAKILRDRILETVSSPPSTALLRILARRAWDEVWSQNTRAVAKELGFDENAVGALDAYMAEASDEELLAVLTRLLIQKLVGESGHLYHGDSTIKRLREIAGELGVDVKAARAEATPKKRGKKRVQTNAKAGAA